jgi:glycogen operon protein
MLVMGDERGRTQHGNNNAYCQDNEISWLDWSLDDERMGLLEFTQSLIGLRKAHPVFRRVLFLTGEHVQGSPLPDAWWFRPDGRRMTRRDWEQPDSRVLGLFLNGLEIGRRTREGETVEDDSYILLFNASETEVSFQMPARRFGRIWELELATQSHTDSPRALRAREFFPLLPRSLALLRRLAS